MRQLKKISVATLALALTVGLMACSSSASNDENAAKEEGVQAKKEMKVELKDIKKEQRELAKTDGYIKGDDFDGYKSDFNLLAKSVKSSAELTMNDDDMIKDNTEQLEKDVESLTGEDAIEAKKRLSSAKTIYQTTMMENIHALIDETNVSNKDHNELASFVFLHSGEDVSMNEIDEDVESAIESINFVPKNKIETIKDEIKKHRECFSKEQLQQLDSALENIDSSLDGQIKLLESFKTVYINDGTSRDDRLEEVKTDYGDANVYVTDLEVALGVAKQ